MLLFVVSSAATSYRISIIETTMFHNYNCNSQIRYIPSATMAKQNQHSCSTFWPALCNVVVPQNQPRPARPSRLTLKSQAGDEATSKSQLWHLHSSHFIVITIIISSIQLVNDISVVLAGGVGLAVRRSFTTHHFLVIWVTRASLISYICRLSEVLD